MFTSGLVSLAAIFSVEYEKNIFNITSCILVLGVLITCVSVFGALYKILIMSSLKPAKEFILAKHQIITFTILLIALIIIGLYPQHLFSELAVYLEGGSV